MTDVLRLEAAASLWAESRTADRRAKLQRVQHFSFMSGLQHLEVAKSRPVKYAVYHSTHTYTDPSLLPFPTPPTSISHQYQVQALFL